MRRLLWAGIGAAVAVVAAQKVRTTARRYTPAGVQDQVDAARERAGSALEAAVRRFGEARAEREAELTTTLLVQPEGGDPHAVLGRRRRRASDDWAGDDWAGDDWGTDSRDDGRPARRAAAGTARPTGRVDPDEPLYDF